MKRFYWFTIFAVATLVAVGLVARYLDLRYIPSGADQQVIEITARTTDTYVDATSAIRDGITQLSSGNGGVLFFGPGKYLVRETIVVPSNITIQGVGAGEVGPTMLILGTDQDMNASGVALLEIQPGAENVIIQDIELRSMTPGPNVYPRYDTVRIRDENTTAIRIPGGSATTRNLQFENVRIVNFTYGIDVGASDGNNYSIRDVKIKSLSSGVNHWAMRVRSTSATNWDLQNFNVVEMLEGQNGILFERAGKMSFMQLSCASTLHNAALCLDIRERSGELYFVQAHVEGPAEGFRVKQQSSQPIYFVNSALAGYVEQESVIYSLANRYWSQLSSNRIHFTGPGSSSTLYRCGDVFTNGAPNPLEVLPAELYPGLSSLPEECNFDLSSIAVNFDTHTVPFTALDWIISGNSPSAAYLNVRNFGAVGDGVTDDTAAFRTALQEAGFWYNSTIVVPNGIYRISDTLVLDDGISIVGAGNSTLFFTATDKPLFLVRAMQSDTIIKRGISLQALQIEQANASDLGQTTAVELSGNRGAASDFIFEDLVISNFNKGIIVKNDSGAFDEQQPQFDSIALRNLIFSNNNISIEMRDQNASNWNIINTQIQSMRVGQTGIKVDGGHVAISDLECDGQSAQNKAEACIHLSRHSNVYVERVQSSNNKFAMYVEWPIGYMPFPVVVKDSDLRDGFYAAGKIYLLSVNNIFTDNGQGDPLGSQATFFNSSGSDNPANVYPGIDSRVRSCSDEFRTLQGEPSVNPPFVGLTNAPVICSAVVPPPPPPTDTTAPVMSNGAPSSNQPAGTTQVAMSLTTDESATCKYGTATNQTYANKPNTFATTGATTHSTTLTGLTNGTSYTYRVRCQDTAGNANTTDLVISFAVSSPAGDTTAPTVSLTAPSANATVSGSSVTVSASASDNVGVVGVQFKLDGSNLGAEDTSSPYSITWSTTTASNGTHSLTAVARDSAGNTTTSTAVSVTVSNTIPPATVANPSISPNGGSFTSSQQVTLSTATTGASIRYTTDGSNPTSSNGALYSSPFTITSTTTIKAIAYQTGSTDSAVTSATFTLSTPPSSGGGGGGGGGGSSNRPPSTPPGTPNPPSTPSPSGVVLPPNVIAGQTIKFPDSPAVYLVQSTGLHPFDTYASLQAYQAVSGAVIITRSGTASTYTVSPVFARTILDQGGNPVPSSSPPANGTNFVCSGNPTIYYMHNSQKLAYSELASYQAWNGNSFAGVISLPVSTCATIPSGGIVPMPEGSIVKIPGGPEIYRIEGTTARPFTSYSAFLRDSAGKITYTISVPYLHTYSRGENIN